MLTSSPLPPRGVFVPTSMLFHSELPSAVLVTWIQLRALAWKGWSTPAMSLAEFASILGIHPSRLGKHLDHLQSSSSLSLRTTSLGKLVISFPELPLSKIQEHPDLIPPPAASLLPAHEPEISTDKSYFPRQILGYLTYDEKLHHPDESVTPAPLLSEPDKSLIGLSRLHSLCSQDVV